MKAVPIRARMAEISDLQFALLLSLPVLIFLVLVVAYPLGHALWMSFHEVSLFGGYHEEFLGTKNYIHVWKSPEFWNSVWISLRFTVVSVVVTIGLGMALALVLARQLPGRGLVRSLVILPWAMSLYGVGIMFQYFWSPQTGFPTAMSYLLGINRPITVMNEKTVLEVLAVGHAWSLAPLVAFFLLVNIDTIPRRLYHLADLDNLGVLGKFFHVTLPPLRYTLFVFTSIATVLSLKVFDYIFTLSGGGPGTASSTLTHLIYREAFRNLNLGFGTALSFYLLALIIGMTLMLFVVWGRKEALR